MSTDRWRPEAGSAPTLTAERYGRLVQDVLKVTPVLAGERQQEDGR